MSPRAVLTAAGLGTAILVSARAGAATIGLDAMDRDQGAWGPAAAPERDLVREGEAALRWTPEAGPLVRDDLAVDLQPYHSLRLWVYSPQATFARVRMELPVEGEATPFALTLKVDWAGWNRMELPEVRFREGPADRAAGWPRVRGLRLTQAEPGFAPGFLVLDGLELSADWPEIHFSEDEKLIDWMYWGAEGMELWRPTDETLREPEGSYGLSRYWCWGYLWTIEDPARQNVCAYSREFGTDIAEYGTLEVRMSNDAEGCLSIHAQIDGEWTTPIAYHPGTGHFEELQIPLPEGARRLDAVTLDISEPPGEIGGPARRQLKCNVHWLLLRKRGAPIGSPPLPIPKIESVPPHGTLEADGLPGAVYFSREDLPLIRRLFLDGAAQQLGQQTLAQADGFLGTDPETYAGRWFPTENWVSARSGKAGFALDTAARTTALAYVITGEQRYADYARRALLVAARIDEWTSGEFARYPLGWGGHGNVFDESAVSYDLALAYDWAYTALSDDERRTVEEALLQKGVWWTYDSLKHNPGLLKMNQGAVFDSQMGCALLALEGSRPELREMREQAEEWLWQGLVDYSLQDGESNEGVGYWHYTWNTAVRLLAAMGQRDPEGLRGRCPEHVKQAMDWLVHMKSNASETWRSQFICDAVGGPPSASVSAFFAKYLGSTTGAWFQQLHGRPDDLLSALMWDHDTPAEEPPTVVARHFRGAGYLFLREGFEYGDTLFSLLGGPRLSGHDQRDRASFTIEAFGEPLAMDPGMISYDNPIHTSLANTRLHNTLTVSGGEARTDAKVTAFFTSPLLDYVAVDATGCYPDAEHFVRRAVYLRPDHFVIADDMRLKTPGSIEWNLNSSGELSLGGNRLLAQGKAGDLVVDFMQPARVSMETEVWPCGHPGLENHHATVRATEGEAGRWLTSLYPVRRGEAEEVRVGHVASDGAEGIAIDRRLPGWPPGALSEGGGAYHDLVLERRGDGAWEAAGLRSDARLVTQRGVDDVITGWAVLEGTSLHAGAVELLAASALGCYSYEDRLGTDRYYVYTVRAPPGTTVRLRAQPRTAYVGSVAGGFVPGQLQREGEGSVFTVPQGEAPPGGYWLILDKPDWLNTESRTPAHLAETLIDGMPMPAGGLAPGVVPNEASLTFEPGANPIDPGAVSVYLDGTQVTVDQYARTQTAGGGVTVTVPVRERLDPKELQPEFYTVHTVEVALRDQGLWRTRASGRVRFAIQPKLDDDAMYLSDIDPISAFTHGGLLRDRAYIGDAITLDGTDFPKGLTTHPEPQGPIAYAEVIYDLTPYQGKRTAFRALVGVEEGAAGTCTFGVFTRVAGGEWQERLQTGELTSTSDPVNVSVPLAGVNELRLYVTDAGDGINSDHAVWAMARLE